jgi:hypothetical protein
MTSDETGLMAPENQSLGERAGSSSGAATCSAYYQRPRRGVAEWTDANPDKADLFEYEEQYFGFPCCACKHRYDDDTYCYGCGHLAV